MEGPLDGPYPFFGDGCDASSERHRAVRALSWVSVSVADAGGIGDGGIGDGGIGDGGIGDGVAVGGSQSVSIHAPQ